MLRVSAICEEAGVPAASLVCEGFLKQAATTSVGLGLPGMPVALVPGHLDAQSAEELRHNILTVTTDKVIDCLTRRSELGDLDAEPGAREIVFRGGHDELNEFFYDQEWTDGLPIVPPTRAKIEAFLRFTDRDADEVLGIMLPDRRAATVWSVAVNGVMAGCRPEYMPVLIALVEAMADPEYGVEHSGNTPGAETLIILNGPIIQELGFNYTQGVMRDGFLANTSVGRFWRLYVRNVAGFLPHKNDKATYGNTWRVVIAENEEVLARIGWEPICIDNGIAKGKNAVMIARYTGGNILSSVSGSTPEEMMPYLTDGLTKLSSSWQLVFTVGGHGNSLRPLVLLSPIHAEMLSRAGWTKQDIKKYLFAHARVPAWQFERQLRDWSQKPIWNLAEEYRLGHIPEVFCESDDPNRLVPIVCTENDFMIAVTGDPARNSIYVFAHNGVLGFPTAKKIQLPKDWDAKLAAMGR